MIWQRYGNTKKHSLEIALAPNLLMCVLTYIARVTHECVVAAFSFELFSVVFSKSDVDGIVNK